MPVLKQYKDGNGYYVITSYPGLGFANYQITDEGDAVLRSRGVSVEAQFSMSTLQILKQRGLVFTGRSGMSGVANTTKGVTVDESLNSLPLFVETIEDGWRLSMLLPELDLAKMKDLIGESPAHVLARCNLLVDGVAIIPATRLWPGMGGTTVGVDPHAARYTVEPQGSWPEAWDCSTWSKGAAGLKPAGNVFFGEASGGHRAPNDKPLVPGEMHFFLHCTTSSLTPGLTPEIPLPRTMEPAYLGSRKDWHAWGFRIPEEIDPTIVEWCTARGLLLERLNWGVRLISPPAIRYSADGTPISDVGTPVIVAAVPMTDGSRHEPIEVHLDRDGLRVSALHLLPGQGDDREREAPGAHYLTFTPTVPGTYRMNSDLPAGRSMSLLVVADSAMEIDVLTANLPPLRVRASTSGSERWLDAFTDTAGPHQVALNVNHPPDSLLVSCPIPVDLYWSLGHVRRSRKSIGPVEVPEVLANDLRATLSKQERLVVSLDAGAFGRLVLHLMPPLLAPINQRVDYTAELDSLPREIAARARWVMAAIAGIEARGDAKTVCLTLGVRKSLATFSRWPTTRSLAHLTVVPRRFVPHLYFLAAALDDGRRQDRGPAGEDTAPHLEAFHG